MIARAIVEEEVSGQIGAALGARSPARVTHRNGYRS